MLQSVLERVSATFVSDREFQVMNKIVKALDAPEEVEEVIIPEEPKNTREIDIPASRTKLAAAAEVVNVDGKWIARRVDGKPRWSDKFLPPTSA